MTCHQCQAMLPALLEGDLTADERRAVEEHLAGCIDCRRERVLLAGSRQAVRELGQVPAPPDFGARLRRRLIEAAPTPWYRRPVLAWAAAVSVALVLISWPWWLSMPGRPDTLALDAPRDTGLRGLTEGLADESPGSSWTRLNITARVTVDEIQPAVSSIAVLALESGGRVEYGMPVSEGFLLVIHVLGDHLYSTLRQLEALGSLTWEHMQGYDLEEEYLVTQGIVEALEKAGSSISEPGAYDEDLGRALARLERLSAARSEVRVEITLVAGR